MKCVAHLLGLIHECRTMEECNAKSDSSSIDSHVDGDLGERSAGDPNSVGDSNHVHSDDWDSDDDQPTHRTYKDDSALRDQQSTGRKRAARMYPLNELAPCDWAMKKNCGGGKFPITGCLANLQQARHHGPDKNTLNNEKENVHRICHTCHNRWHTLNDENYVWGDLYEQHNPSEATAIDLAESEEFWEGRKLVKAKD